MAYATLAQLEISYSRNLLERLATRSGDDLVPDDATIDLRCQAALDAAAGVMDGYLAMVYAVPTVSTLQTVMDALRQCNCALAISDLVLQKGYVVGSEDEQLVSAASKHWLNWLTRIVSGKVILPGASAIPGVDGVGPMESFFVTSEPAFFPSADRFA